jgi:hypothetical protein
MKCQNCNADLEPYAKFCDSCGAPVAAPGEPVVIPSSAETAFSPPIPSINPPEPMPASVPVSSIASGSKVLGFIDADKAGLVALILGIAGIVLSCVGCGGLISIVGVIVGIMSLKTPDRQKGMIGLILSGLGLLITLIFGCILIFFYISNSSGNSYYGY